MFVAAFGAAAGNFAMQGMATGGVYIGGGIPPKILPGVRDLHVHRRLQRQGAARRPRQGACPCSLILNKHAGLDGAAVYANACEQVARPRTIGRLADACRRGGCRIGSARAGAQPRRRRPCGAAVTLRDARRTRRGYEETSRYEDVMAFVRAADEASPLVHLTTFGYINRRAARCRWWSSGR